LSSTDARAARGALEALIARAPVALPAGFDPAVERYVELLLEANQRMNLTRIVEPEAIARLHLLDALAALRWLDAWTPRRALDIGSGGGMPGLVLALARRDVSWTLLDSVARKADAMRGFVDGLHLTRVSVVAARAEELGRHPEHRESYDLVTARALAALPVLLEYALPLARVGGHVLAWKGRMPERELDAGRAAARSLGGSAPILEPSGFDVLGDHRFVVVTKERPTPAAYPRRPGVPARRPLG
jgi:16S rRNA (guanine527-N7)-methyltransferase